MALTIIIIITWLTGTIFFLIPKKLSFLQNFIVFMLLTIISRNIMTILTLELQWIETTKEHVLYMFFLLQREVIMPIGTLLWINIYYQLEKSSSKILFFLGILFGIHSLDYLSIYLDVVEYRKWNYFYDILHEGTYLVVGLGLSKLVLFLKQKEFKL